MLVGNSENHMTQTYATYQIEGEAATPRLVRRQFPKHFASLLLLERGTLHGEEGMDDVTGPALCFWPQAQFPKLFLAPGSCAKLLGLSDTLVLDGVGTQAESVHLRMMVEQPFQVALEIDPRFPHIESLFEWFAFEVEVPQHRSPMMLSAYLRCLLIIGLRVHVPPSEDLSTKRTEILRRFRHLVELHYREHWKVSDYANELGVEYDRLHHICQRYTGQSPANLVHDRMIDEAKARIEQTGHSLKEIAHALGFADGSRFSHFFKRRTGIAPATYRADVSQRERDDQTSKPTSEFIDGS